MAGEADETGLENAFDEEHLNLGDVQRGDDPDLLAREFYLNHGDQVFL